MQTRRNFFKQSLKLSVILLSIPVFLNAKSNKKKTILLRSSWQTINIGDIGHTPGVLALLEKYLPEVDVRLWVTDVSNGVEEMLLHRFPKLIIIKQNDTFLLREAFNDCDFLLHGSGPFLVAAQDIVKWKKETNKPFGVYGITLPEEESNEDIIGILDQAKFVFFRDTISMELAKIKGVKSPILEFGPDGAFACDLRNDAAALKFIAETGLVEGKFLCVIPKYRKTPKWEVPGSKIPFNEAINTRNQIMKEHDLKPYRDAIIDVVRKTSMKVLICPEDVTQVALGKEMLYDPLPEDVKKMVVWRNRFWLTDEALSVYVRSAGYFGLEQHSPIMCIGNGIPALLGRFEEQTSKGYMWYNIGLGDWFFDSDNKNQINRLSSTVLSLVNNPNQALEKTLTAKEFVEKRQAATMKILKKSF